MGEGLNQLPYVGSKIDRNTLKSRNNGSGQGNKDKEWGNVVGGRKCGSP